MKLRRSVLSSTLVVSSCLAGCSAGDSEKSLSVDSAPTATTESALTPSAGLVPYPVQVRDLGTTHEPIKDASNQPIVTWRGSLVDLLAADAWAQCTVGMPTSNARSSDGYLDHLGENMRRENSCFHALDTCSTTAGCGVPEQWRRKRSDPTCNVDTSSGATRGVVFRSRDASTYDLGSPPGVGGPAAAEAIAAAQAELRVADVSLCMAQRLRETEVTGQGLLLSGRDHLELLEVVRERAQLAMLQYALLGQAFAWKDARANDVTNKGQVLPVLHAFAADAANAPKLARMGQDFAAAIELHTEVTARTGELLLRNASAHTPRTRPADSRPDDDWGAGSWRQRLLRLLYGGDPLFWTDDNLWSGYRGTSGGYEPYWDLTYVTEPAARPEVDELLRLARQANGLVFRGMDDGSADSFDLQFIDEEASAVRLYRIVEASLRHPECRATAAAGGCTKISAADDVPVPTDAEANLLWTRRRISLDHARMLVRKLWQAMPHLETGERAAGAVTLSKELGRVLRFSGKHRLLLDQALATTLPGESGLWYQLDAGFATLPLDVEDRAPAFAFGVHVPSGFDKYNVGSAQGFRALDGTPGAPSTTTTDGSATMRVTGAVSALSAVDEAISRGTAWAADSPAAVKAFFDRPRKAQELITTAIGSRSLSIRPAWRPRRVFDDCAEWGNTTPDWCWRLPQILNGTEATWEVTVTTTAGDPNRTLVVAPVAAAGSTVALRSDYAGFDGRGRKELIDDVGRVYEPASETPAPGGRVRRTYTVTGAGAVNVYLRKAQPTASDPYVTLGSNVVLAFTTKTVPVDGKYNDRQPVAYNKNAIHLAYGGRLNALTRRAFALDPIDWSRPAFDAFGLPVSWFPPTDATLLGGSAGETSVSFFLRMAKSAATSATGKVREAMAELLRQETDEAALDAARRKSAGMAALDRKAVCGAASTCSGTYETVARTRLVSPPACTDPVCSELVKAVAEVVPSTVPLPTDVVARLDDAAPPSFSQYNGGSLPGLLVRAWSAARRVRTTVSDGARAVDARVRAVAEARALLGAAEDRVARDCSDAALKNAVYAGWSWAIDEENYVFAGGRLDKSVMLFRGDEIKSRSFSPSALLQQMATCREATRSQPPAQARVDQARAEAWGAVGSATSSLVEAMASLRSANADLAKAFGDADVAAAREQLTAQLTADQLPTRFGTYRRVHSQDVDEAVRALESARRYAVSARRAIEARYLVDLSSLNAPEANSDVPARWADSIYETDLDVRGAAGLSIPVAGQPPTATSLNKVLDYVDRLEGFMANYAISRPTAAVQAESRLISLPGPSAKERIVDADGIPADVLSAAARAWSFYCPATRTWVPHPGSAQSPTTASLSTACDGVRPSLARMAIRLDPWARLEGDYATPPRVLQHNVRWRRFMLNLPDAGALTCSKAVDPDACTASQTVPFHLAHQGPLWTTSYDQSWFAFAAPSGLVEAGQALAFGKTLSRIEDWWGKPYVDGVGRSELVERPVAGTYTIELELVPELEVDALSRLQLLVETSYWARQGSSLGAN